MVFNKYVFCKKILTKFCKLCYVDRVRRSYRINISVNRRKFEELVIDSHFEIKHSDSMSDEIILTLVQDLNGREIEPDAVDDEGFKYFKTEPMFFKGKPYRLIWLIDPDEEYIGVLNCFRRTQK